MEAIILFLLVPALILLLRLPWQRQRWVPAILSKIFLLLFFLSVGLYLSTFFLSHYDIYWRGYHSTRSIFIFLTLCSMIFYWIHPANKFPLIVTAFSVLVTFIGTAVSPLLISAIADEYNDRVFYNDSKYRLEEVTIGIIRIAELPKLFVKNGLFEKCYTISKSYGNLGLTTVSESYIPKDDIKKIEIVEVSKNRLSITFYHSADTNQVRKNPLNFIVDIQ
jgi:hypothetical protein